MTPPKHLNGGVDERTAVSPAISRRRTLELLGAAVVTTSLAGCTGDDGDDGNGDDNTVDMTADNLFQPDELTVSVGTTVTWENVSEVGHTVTAYVDEIPDDAEYFASGGFDAEQAARDGYTQDLEGNIAAEETYEYTFDTPGTYEYFCVPHEGTMTGTITVEE